MKQDRKESIQLVKNICLYKPTLIERTGGSRRKRFRSRGGNDAANSNGFQYENYGSDYQQYYASSQGRSSHSGSRQRSTGVMTPNQQIYEMYNQAQKEVLEEDRM